MKKTILGSALILALALPGAGCSDEGPAEKAGREIDEAMDEAGESLEEAMDDMEDAADEYADDMEDAGEELEDEMERNKPDSM